MAFDGLPPIDFEASPACERGEVGVVCRQSGYSVMFELGASTIDERPSWLATLKELVDQFPEVELRVHGVSSTAEDNAQLQLAAARARALINLLRSAGISEKQIALDPPERRGPIPLEPFGLDGDASRTAGVSVRGDVTTSTLPARGQ